MADSSKKVVRQAAFLMAAHLISSVIGLLYRSPLHSIMGSAGAGYYSYAYDWYTIILLIASYSIPSAVSKVMAERLAVGEYRNAQKVFKAALLYVLIVGGIGASLAFFGAPLLLREQPDAVLALRILSPTILLSGFLGVFRGYFQAHNNMKPTAVSQVAEQILNAVFSVLMAWIFIRPYKGDANLVGKYGAAGGTVGTGAGVAAGLLFMIFVYWINRGYIQGRIRKDRHRNEESYRQVFRDILLMVTPIIFATFIYNLTTIIDQKLFTNLMLWKETAADEVNRLYGIFGYNYKPIINIPIALASATSTALIPAIATSMAERKMKEAAAKIEECIKLTMFISIPSAVGLAVLSYPVMRLLYPRADIKAAAILLTLGAVSVVLFSYSTVTNGVLQGSGYAIIPVRNAAISIAVNVAVLFICDGLLNTGVYGILLATIMYSLTYCVLNLLSVKHRLRYHCDLKETYLTPILCAAVMGVIVAAIYWLPAKLLPGVFGRYLLSGLLTLLAILTGVIAYIVMFTKFTGLTDDELRQIPLGTRMLQLLRLLHLR